VGLFHKTLKDAERLAEKDLKAALAILEKHIEECNQIQSEGVRNLDHAFTWYKNELGKVIHGVKTGSIKNTALRINEGLRKEKEKMK